jgi:hypothetical protein
LTMTYFVSKIWDKFSIVSIVELFVQLHKTSTR